MRHIKLYENFLNEVNLKTKVASEIALTKRNIALEAVKLIVWWGGHGYLYYNYLKPGPAILSEKGEKLLTILYNSHIDNTFNDYMYRRKTTENFEDDPVWADENIHRFVTKDWVDKTFRENMRVVKRPFKIAKKYDKTTKNLGEDNGWYSFSTRLNVGAYGQFGDDYIEYELPVGFKYIDASGLADFHEVIIWGPDLKNAKIITN